MNIKKHISHAQKISLHWRLNAEGLQPSLFFSLLYLFPMKLKMSGSEKFCIDEFAFNLLSGAHFF